MAVSPSSEFAGYCSVKKKQSKVPNSLISGICSLLIFLLFGQTLKKQRLNQIYHSFKYTEYPISENPYTDIVQNDRYSNYS